MHNHYSYLYNQTVFEVLQEHRGDGEAMVFARSATAGCQQFPVHWGEIAPRHSSRCPHGVLVTPARDIMLVSCA
jgi:hypothetical protein